MYDPNLEKLIEIALKEGDISEKSRNILLKKAQSLGVDLDEFEMVLEDKIKSLTPNKKNSSEAIKCPACGSFLSGLSAVCKDCGYEFRNTKASDSITEFFKRLDAIEEKRVEMPNKWGNTDQRKEDLIINFPVPSTKEDILQFFELSLSKLRKVSLFASFLEEGRYPARWNEIWKAKAIQIYKKAETVLAEDQALLKKLEADLVKNGAFGEETARSIFFGNLSPTIDYGLLLPLGAYLFVAAACFLSLERDSESERSLGMILAFGAIAGIVAVLIISLKTNIPEITKKNIVFIIALILTLFGGLSYFKGLEGIRALILVGLGCASIYGASKDKTTLNCEDING